MGVFEWLLVVALVFGVASPLAGSLGVFTVKSERTEAVLAALMLLSWIVLCYGLVYVVVVL